ncbi:MAG TPA: pyruvate dehydrogenase complex dihydrolipoamide acetyltransferase [Terriglobia bacterium]|nr:pyruvate dehydrogenase complex dihydrolipoamide acetyltransferase [Terriglobia bacterium]
MAEITMPKLSDTMTEGVVVRWHKKKGDVVATGDVLAEIETDKATMEMEAFDDGVLKEIYVPEGQKVSVGERIALIGNEQESPSVPVQKVDALPKRIISHEKAPARKPKPDEIQHAHKTASAEEGYSQAVPKKLEPAAEGAKGVRVKASPLARKTATQMSVDLARIEGSGPGGRIIQEDIFTAAKAKASGPVPVWTTPETESELIPLSPMRRVIAQRMVESKTTIPHFYLTVELDVAKLLELRAQANESLAATSGGKLSINDFVLKACVECLQRVPQLNSSFSEEGILRFTHVHLGFAVSLDEGLITPVLRNAERKTLRQLSTEAREMTERARAKKLKPEEYQRGTFTVSNLGASGIDSFQAIINPPQSGILAVGSVTKKPVVNAHDQIVVGQRLNVTLCCDHRVVDGAVGAKFLQEFRALIEHPTLMLL